MAMTLCLLVRDVKTVHCKGTLLVVASNQGMCVHTLVYGEDYTLSHINNPQITPASQKIQSRNLKFPQTNITHTNDDDDHKIKHPTRMNNSNTSTYLH